jgi:hypothetical protein
MLINPSSSSSVDIITGTIYGVLPTTRVGAGVVSLGDSVYVFGGIQSPGKSQFKYLSCQAEPKRVMSTRCLSQ